MIVLKSPFETGGAFFSGFGATAGCHGGGRSRRSTRTWSCSASLRMLAAPVLGLMGCSVMYSSVTLLLLGVSLTTL